MKIGILTYHRSHNYGAYVQSYCLSRLLKETIKCEVEIIDYTSKRKVWFYRKEIVRDKNLNSIIFNYKKYRMFNREVHKLPLSSKSLKTDNMKKFQKFVNGKYDVIIVGSDEVWKLDNGRGFPNAYWLPGVDSCIKMSFAASSRNNMESISAEVRNQIAKLLESFKYISVRDMVTKELIDSITKRKSLLVCDPTMAYSFKFDKNLGRKLLKEKLKVDTNKKCLGIMVNSASLAKCILKAKEDSNIELISLFYSYKKYKSNPNISPLEWGQIIGALDGLVTTFFHGMCISMNANVPFLLIESRNLVDDKYSKSYDLLSRYDFQDNYLRSSDEKNRFDRIKKFISDINKENIHVDFSRLKSKEKKSFIKFIDLLKNIEEESNSQ